MARHNEVFLYGSVSKPPQIIKNSEGEYLQAILNLTVIRGLRDIEYADKANEIKYAHPIIITKNPEIIKKIEMLHENDMVTIKGTFTTKSNVKKSKKCPCCGEKNGIIGELVYIHPISIKLENDKNLSQTDILKKLRENCEFSNSVHMVGNLCRDVNYYTDGKKRICQYQLAINRNYHIREDAAEIKTDYPWIYSYGDIAENDASVMHEGTLVLIDGMLRTREIKDRKLVCEKCGTEYFFNDNALEVIPYKTEYLQNFYSFDDKEKIQENMLNNLKAELFNPEDMNS